MKNKKVLIVILGLLLIGTVGVTIAYFMSSATFENVFNLGIYKVVTTEVFESPTSWAPGEEIPKTIITTNEGTIPAAVRVSYTEQWLDENGNDITSSINNGTVTINLDNTSDWVQEGNYYYYKYILDPNETTSSFIRSVTLNYLDGESCTLSQGGTIKICTPDNSALGATYILTITKETVQADQYDTVWNTQVEIKPLIEIITPNRTKDNLQVGDEICIKSECFNFIGYDGNNIKMLSKWNLKVGNIYETTNLTKIGEYSNSDIGYGLQSSDMRGWVDGTATSNGTVVFSETNYWDNNGSPKSDYPGTYYPGPNYPTVYDPVNYKGAPGNNNYSVAYYVEEYKEKLETYGVTILNARLLTYAEAVDSSIGCNISEYSCPTTGFITNTTFWLGSACYDNSTWFVTADGYFSYYDYYYDDYFGVRPVIVISKSDF